MINQFSAEFQKIISPTLDKVKLLHGKLQEIVLLILDHQEAMMMRGMIMISLSDDHQWLEFEIRNKLQENLLELALVNILPKKYFSPSGRNNFEKVSP